MRPAWVHALQPLSRVPFYWAHLFDSYNRLGILHRKIV